MTARIHPTAIVEEGVEIGEGFALAGKFGSEAHDEIAVDRRRETNRAGGIEAGVSNGEDIIVRAGMKPLPTLMKPLRSVDLATGEPATALVERSDVGAVEALAVVAEAAVAWELAVLAHDKFGGAPSVVNGSWDDGEPGRCEKEFDSDIAALRAAGIIPVFAAGHRAYLERLD